MKDTDGHLMSDYYLTRQIQSSGAGGISRISSNILMVGVGGQGVIMASDILAETGMINGFDVKKSDSIGMAQRGGSVVSHIRLGEKVFSPLIKMGEADFLIGFEELEAARWAPYLRTGGIAVVADVVLVPLSVNESKLTYPDWDVSRRILSRYAAQVTLVPAVSICQKLGNPRALNMVLLGFLATYMEIAFDEWQKNIQGKLPARYVESSLKAFAAGAAEAKKINAGDA
ncbi:MAG: indolepyruvate oxidoreductase subunit beta [Chloroflexota bacterium]